MSSNHPPFLQILPNRVRRNYRGGALLEAWTGECAQTDGEQPEDWIGSTVEAVNPGLPPIPQEGLTAVVTPAGQTALLRDALAAAPEYYLGDTHLHAHGHGLGFLAKLLDSAIRLHVQAHPTAAFAQQHLGSRYGKLETYVVLAVRAGMSPCLRLGFQHSPGREGWRRIIETQDIAAMDACFESIPLRVGDVWRVPGGLPHAIGAGALVLEVMEPSDWVVRCEFEREGIVVPPQGRFMGRGLDFCLDVFDYTAYSVEAIEERCQLQPRLLSQTDALREEQLVDSSHTDCFAIRRLRVRGTAILPLRGLICLCLVVQGEGVLVAGGCTLILKQGQRFFLPAAGAEPCVHTLADEPLELLVCEPVIP